MILYAAGKNLSEVVETITWSGDTRQVARKLGFNIVNKDTDPYLPKVTLNEGDPVIFRSDSGADLFWGIIFDVDKTASANTINYLAYDLMFYVMESEISRVFKDTPEKITELVCGELGVPFLSAAKTGIQVYYPCLGKPGYEAIIAAYTYASRQNGKKYIPLMKKDSLRVIQKGLSSGVVLNGDFNLKDANYKTTLTKLVNKVIIVDEKGNKVGLVEDAESQKKYGAIQKIYKKEKNVDANAAAKNLLMGIDKSATAKALSDYKCVSGYSVYIREPITGLIGKFYVESDMHTFKNAEESMDLSLAFVNLMDEREIETEKKEADASA